MKKYQRGLMAATLALSSYVAIPAYADVLNIPASAALMNGDPLNSGCQVGNGPYISSVAIAGICDFQIPLTVPTGHTIQQIAVVYGADNNFGPSLINAGLNVLNFVAPPDSTQFESIWTGPVPAGTLQVKRLMAQTKFGAFPDAFVVQPNTMYQVVLHLESGAIAAGLQVTYQ